MAGQVANTVFQVTAEPPRIAISINKENAIGYIEAEVEKKVDVETHTLFIGKVVDAQMIKEGEVMTYEYYHLVKNGSAPKTAPTFQPVKPKRKRMYRCTVCGYIYDPDKGDPDSGIPPGTDFEDIPDDWVCPVCGVSKDMFEPLED